MKFVLLAAFLAFSASAQPREAELRLVEEVESLTGSHARYRQIIGGLEVIGQDVVVESDAGRRIRAIRGERLRSIEQLPRVTVGEDGARGSVPFARIEHVDQVLLQQGAKLHRAWRVIGRERPLEPYIAFVDVETGAILKMVPMFANASARVFDPNPVTSLNDPALQDQDDAASAVPDAAYVPVELLDLPASGPLSGPNVRIVDLQPPAKTGADVSQSLLFERNASGFEEVMAYFHLDRAQRYLQSLGYTGSRRIIDQPIEVDAHAASGADNSFYVGDFLGGGTLYFGDGGVDDAEDADILLHEYAHAIHDDIGRGAFFGTPGSQPAALGEGFGDYWAFSYGYEASLRTGRDPFCIGDWDARCGGGPSTSCGYPVGADCLRRVDSPKTMDNYIFSEQRGTEHRNGEVWSSALRRVFEAIVQQHGVEQGRRISDQIVVESHFGLASTPTFRLLATRMLEVDRVLFGGIHQTAICSSMVQGRILGSGDCGTGRRGDLTFFQSADRDRPIPDLDPAGITSSRFIGDSRLIDRVYVQVRIAHPYRGDLRITLAAPDGRTVLLDAPGVDPAANISATYGLDALPEESLDLFRGMPANGEWKLFVRDDRGRDVGTLLSWALLIRFQGDVELSARPSSAAEGITIPVVAKTPGAEATNFISDVRLFNRSQSVARGFAVYTPAGAGGNDRFSAVQFEVESGQTLALDDIVASFFGTFGSGSLELQGDAANLVATSRTYNALADRTYGQFIGPANAESAARAGGPPVHLLQLRSSGVFRTNIGLTNLAVEGAVVRLEIFDAAGTLIESREETLGPFGHSQFPVLTGTIAEVARAEVRVLSGGGTVVSYGSVVDNESGDSIYIPAAPAPAAQRAMVIPVVARTEGANETFWRSDVFVANPTSGERSAVLTYRGSDGSMRTSGLTLAARTARLIEDVVGGTFGLTSGRGQLEISSSELLVTSRTWTPGAEGTYGQFVGAVEGGAPRSGSVHSIQIESSLVYRTNAGITELAGAPAVVRVRLFDGGGAERFARNYSVDAHGQIQFSLALEGAPNLSNGRLSFELIDGAGSIFGYASVIDNRSGDPIFIPAQ